MSVLFGSSLVNLGCLAGTFSPGVLAAISWALIKGFSPWWKRRRQHQHDGFSGCAMHQSYDIIGGYRYEVSKFHMPAGR